MNNHLTIINNGTVKREVIILGAVNCVLYILFFMICRLLNLMHISGLRMANFVFLAATSIILVNIWKRRNEAVLPFLAVFGATMAAGVISFFLFGLFIYIYSRFDVALTELFITQAPANLRQVPAIVVFFEGTGGSIIVALIVMMYANIQTRHK